MPGHTLEPRLVPEAATLFFPRVALTPPGGWHPRLSTRQASFSAHERDLERRGIHGARLVGAPAALLLAGEQLLGCEGWSLGCRMLNLHATKGTCGR